MKEVVKPSRLSNFLYRLVNLVNLIIFRLLFATYWSNWRKRTYKKITHLLIYWHKQDDKPRDAHITWSHEVHEISRAIHVLHQV